MNTNKNIPEGGIANFAVEFWIKHLRKPTPKEPQEIGSFELSSEPTILEIQKINKNYPRIEVLRGFSCELKEFIGSKIKKNETVTLETTGFPKGDLEKIFYKYRIDPYLLPTNTSIQVSLKKIKMINSLGQENIIHII